MRAADTKTYSSKPRMWFAVPLYLCAASCWIGSMAVSDTNLGLRLVLLGMWVALLYAAAWIEALPANRRGEWLLFFHLLAATSTAPMVAFFIYRWTEL